MASRFVGWLTRTHVKVSLVLIIGLTFVGCGAVSSNTVSPTPWPTLGSLGGPAPLGTQIDTGNRSQLVEHYRVDVQAGLEAVFPLEGSRSYPLRIEAIVLSGTIDPELTVYSPAGDVLAHSNHGGPNSPEVIGQLQFPADGYYELGVQSAEGTGTIGISIYRLDPNRLTGGGTFSSDSQQMSGTMRQPQSYHVYRLPLQRGIRVNITARAITPDLTLDLELYGPSSKLIDDSGNIYSGATPSIWNLMPSITGEYTVVLSNRDEHTGDYLLEVKPSEGGGQAEIGSRAMLDLSNKPGKSIWLTLEGKALDGISVEAQAESPGLDLMVDIYDPFGNRLLRADNTGEDASETITFLQFPVDGQYQIQLTSKTAVGKIDYRIKPIRQVDIELGGKIYPGGRAEKGDISGPAMFVVYEFSAQAGTSIGVDAHATGGTGLDLGFDLYNPDGTLLISRDDTVGKDPVLDRIQLLQSGRYIVALWNYSGTTGPYEVFVTTPESPSSPTDIQPQ